MKTRWPKPIYSYMKWRTFSSADSPIAWESKLSHTLVSEPSNTNKSKAHGNNLHNCLYNNFHYYFTIFLFQFFRQAMYMILYWIKEEMLPLLNMHYASCTLPIPALVLDLSNNNKNLPLGLVEHKIDKWQMVDMYRAINPHLATGVAPYQTDVINVLKFLQTSKWLYCGQHDKCRKKTIVHHQDLAVVHQKAITVRPQNSTPFMSQYLSLKLRGWKMSGALGSRNIRHLKRLRAFLPFCLKHTYFSFTTIGSSFGILYITQMLAPEMSRPTPYMNSRVPPFPSGIRCKRSLWGS